MADDTAPDNDGTSHDDGIGDRQERVGDAVRDAAERARGAFNDHVVDPARRAGEAVRESGRKVADGGSAIGLKVIEQAERNSHEAFAAMREAASAKDLSDVMRIQGDYLRQQGQRSLDQAREIGELIMQFGRDAVAPLRDAATRKAD